MKPRRATWLGFLAGVLLLAIGLAWLSRQVLALEHRQRLAQAEARRQDAQRLALWRLDSFLAPLLARESARDAAQYRAFLPLGRPIGQALGPVREGEALAPGPLLSEPALALPGARVPIVRLHFEIEPDGTITSPQAPDDALLAAAGLPVLDFARIDAAARDLDRLRTLIAAAGGPGAIEPSSDAPGLALAEPAAELALADPAGAASQQEFELRRQLSDYAAVPQSPQRTRSADAPTALRSEPATRGVAPASGPMPAAKTAIPETAADSAEMAQAEDAGGGVSAFNASEKDASSFARADEPEVRFGDSGLANTRKSEASTLPFGYSDAAVADAGVPALPEVGALEPRWLVPASGEPELLLVRRVLDGDRTLLQGVWLDWPALREALAGRVADLVPEATLTPLPGGASSGDDARLATIPVSFATPAALTLAPAGLTPTRWSLLLAWLFSIAAAVAIGLVLRAAIALSERRGKFVSAVTHELRTPLTTFQLYSQMLADGMVTDERARADYLQTLKRESAGLAAIVENVLEYARLARRRAPRATPSLNADALLARLRPGLSRRAELAGMDLVVSNELDPRDPRLVEADPASVERVLMNLVDNACKYAGPPADAAGAPAAADADEPDTRIHLDARATADGTLELLVADHGPGIPPHERARVFGEFRRGEIHDRSGGPRGLGIGLALSRALAREAGGDLRLVRRRGHGAEFLLTLPLAGPAVQAAAAGRA